MQPNTHSETIITSGPKHAEEISIKVDGVHVTGIVTEGSHLHLQVTITHPYQDLVKYVDDNYYNYRSAPGVDGERIYLRVQSLLRRIYYASKKLEDNKQLLRQKLKEVLEEVAGESNGGYDRNDFLRDRRALRKQLRSSEIDNHQYQQKLPVIRTRKVDQERKVELRMRGLLEDNFPFYFLYTLEGDFSAYLYDKQQRKLSRKTEPIMY